MNGDDPVMGDDDDNISLGVEVEIGEYMERSVRVMWAPRRATTAIPTSPMPDASSRIEIIGEIEKYVSTT